MTFVIGLTGSIGMGKSTTARLFNEAGVPVWDADGVVHSMYSASGEAAKIIAVKYPNFMTDGAVDRQKLKTAMSRDSTILDEIQGIVHPLVSQHRAAMIESTTAPIFLVDIPLLFETGADEICDGIVVVTAPPDVQKERVMARGEMSEAEFDMILSRQMPDAEKRSRARWVIETITLDAARASVANILSEIEQELADA